MLFLAIITEVIGTSTMKFISEYAPVKGQLFLFVAIGLSYYFLSKAISHIPMGITFAVWEGLGITSITLIGYFLFHESLTFSKVFAIVAIILGIILLKQDSLVNKKKKN